MNIKTTILVLAISLCVSNLFAQEKITIVGERITTTYQNMETFEKTSRSSVKYNFQLGDDPKVMSAGKRGRDLRKHIKDEEALKYFDRSMRQVRWGNATFLGMVGGGVLAAVGFVNRAQKVDDQGNVIRDVVAVTPLLVVGCTAILGSLVARPILFRKFDKNFAKSIELHNNTVSSSSSNNMRIENIGFTLDNRTSRPQLYLSWRF